MLLLTCLLVTSFLAPGVVSQGEAQEARPPQPALRAIGVGFVRHAFGAWTARIADGGFTNSTGRSLRWLPHDTDSAVAAAFAAGKLDIALVGSSVAASAAARGIDLKIFYVLGHSATSEGLVLSTQPNMSAGDPKSLQGKVIATPFGSTPHYRLLESLKRWGLNLNSMRLVNLQTAQIAEAWRRSEIDAAVVSEPLLGILKQRGQPIPLPEPVGNAGVLLWVASSEFVASHSVFLSRFVDVMARADLAMVARQATDDVDSSAVKSISFITGLPAGEVVNAIARYRPPTLEEQASAAWLGGGAQAGLAAELKANAEILRWSGRMTGREPDFAGMLAPEAVQLALTYR